MAGDGVLSSQVQFEKWDKFKRSRSLVMKGLGGWLRIRNLPMDYWRRKAFEAIVDYFGGTLPLKHLIS